MRITIILALAITAASILAQDKEVPASKPAPVANVAPVNARGVPDEIYGKMKKYVEARADLPMESGLHTNLRGGILMTPSSLKPFVLLDVKFGRKLVTFKSEHDPAKWMTIPIDKQFESKFWDYLPSRGPGIEGARISVVVGFSTGTLKYGQREAGDGDSQQTQFFTGVGYNFNPDVSLIAGLAFGASAFNEKRIAAMPGIGVSINPDILGRLFKG